MGKYKVHVLFLVLCLAVIGFSSGSHSDELDLEIVKTTAGLITGFQQNDLWVYLGIPFAAPPVGVLRWKPPEPALPWEGIKETTGFCPACPQPSSIDPNLTQSEDCLYLNVWTPAKTAEEKLPVMVFFYGGAFGKIAGSMSLYNGSALAEKGVIVVTPNYRVGALGFLAHPELDFESPNNSSGNYGLLDQIAALEWVKSNIGSFGGDPSRVTVFGQSAGAESVLIHLANPNTKDLYQQAVVQSGTFWTKGAEINALNSRDDAEELGQAYAISLGFSGPDAIEQMRQLSYQDLTNATPWSSSSFEMVSTRHFEPTIDGWLIPESPDEVFRQRNQNPVPLIIGTNLDDGTTLAADANMTPLEYSSFIEERFLKDAETVLAQYPANSTAEVQVQLEQIMTDYDFTDAAAFIAGSMAEVNANTYRYQYSYVLPGQPYGAFHGSETMLLFKVPLPPDSLTDSVAENLIDLWTRFAKTGDPNGGMNLTWPKYTRQEDQYLDIGDTMNVKKGK